MFHFTLQPQALLRRPAAQRIRQALLTLLVVIPALFGPRQSPVRAESAADHATAQARMVYLPFVTSTQQTTGVELNSTHSSNVYSGVVTNEGWPVVNANVNLDYFDGQAWSTYTTTTDFNGQYSFTNLPTLTNRQLFYVYWSNSESDAQKLAAWVCWPVTINTQTLDDLRCNFDLRGVELLAPGGTTSLPATFTWRPRNITTDVYEFNLMDPSDLSTWWWTDPALGYTDSYTLHTLPDNFNQDRPYGWFVWLYGPDGYGLSYYYYQIMLSNLISSAATDGTASQLPVNQLLSVGAVQEVIAATVQNKIASQLPPATASAQTQAAPTELAKLLAQGVQAAATDSNQAINEDRIVAVVQGGFVDPSFIQQLIVRPERASNVVVNNLQQTHNGAKLVFFEDGTFAFVPVGIGTLVRADLFPAWGTWQVAAGNAIQISASSGASVGVNAANRFSLNGVLVRAENGSWWAHLNEEISVVMAATVNNINFGSNSYKYQDFWLPLQ